MKQQFENGCKVKFDGDDEEFTVSQWDDQRQRGWAADAEGNGWYFSTSDNVTVTAPAPEEEFQF